MSAEKCKNCNNYNNDAELKHEKYDTCYSTCSCHIKLPHWFKYEEIPSSRMVAAENTACPCFENKGE